MEATKESTATVVMIPCYRCKGDGTVSAKKVAYSRIIGEHLATDHETDVKCPVCKGKTTTAHMVMEGQELCNACFEGTWNIGPSQYLNEQREHYKLDPIPFEKDCKYCGGTGRKNKEKS